MAKIILLFDNEHKKHVKKIYEALKKAGHETDSSVKSAEELKKKIPEADFIVMIFSQKANSSPKLIDFYDIIYEEGTPLILYVVSDLEYSVSMQSFLYSNYWIDAATVSSAEALDALKNLVSELSGKPPQKQKTEKNKPVAGKNKKTLTLALIAIFSVVIGIFIYLQMPDKNTKTPENQTTTTQTVTDNKIIPNKDKIFEQNLIGTWRLTDYTDNVVRNQAELQSFNAEIARLKKDFIFKLNADHTFERYNFVPNSQETGYWDVNPQEKVLYVWPPNSKQKDRLYIKKLTQDELMLVIVTGNSTDNQVVTTLTLHKEK